MNKLPAKQIYLLSIIVLGIITLSVYSTYAIFTLESETSDIVNIQTLNALNINTTTYEYKQVIVPADSSINTDVDIYNNFNYDLCYSVWYKVVPASGISTSAVSIYQNTNEALSTSGNMEPITSRRVNIIIKNNNDKDIKVNVGISYSKNEGTCELNISNDKSLISSTMDDTKKLSDIIIKDTQIKSNPANYITYKNNMGDLILKENEKIKISTEYGYKDEIFTLLNPKEINTTDIDKYVSTNDTKYYTCLEGVECRYLYRINEVKKENNTYKITKYDNMIGYLAGESGVRKVDKNYYYYGDNPNNFIYYNCTNDLDTNTCELWRIIGAIYDTKTNKYVTKIIKNDFIDTLNYSDNDNTWSKSNILNELKEYKLTDVFEEEITYKVENLNNNTLTLLKEENKSKIMLMNISDYLNTSICQNKRIDEFDEKCLNNNWLNKNYSTNEWTMTVKYEEPYIDKDTNETITPKNDIVYSIGNNITESVVTNKLNIRPVLYLKNITILLDGGGTYEKPYIVR